MYCRVRDLEIYYEEAGAGRPLLMLHGWPSDHRLWQGDMEPLFEGRAGWRRLYLDLPGMGRTRGTDWITSQDHMLEAALEFVDAVAPGQRFVVAGASYGGYLGRAVVHRRREQIDGVFLNVPVVEIDRARRRLPPQQVIHQDDQFLSALEPEEQDLPDMVVAQSLRMLEWHRRVIEPAVAMADHAFLERLESNRAFSFDVDALPEPFPGPTLILAGRQDNGCGYRDAWELLDNFPRATFAVLDRAGHALQIEQQALFRALVGEWLDRVEEYVGRG